ncbi:DUF4129 domain-containing protein [Fulvivirga sedimenti]|uniref:DUF4129 domain-containing protein n=1 Tax=Fulvivirga sedimenti TaxID=2879465 RepID=A0A9X1HM18_9BACT|nr:DUF4129 domain-containing protein [Fulvivirga sedimenti]MCA6074361.1 DUF4129 domain-containing protein [Fulvivirga sedimenti]
MKNIIRFSILYILLILPSWLSAQEADSLVLVDETPVEVRQIDSEKIHDFQTDSDFDYAAANIPGKSLWEMFKDALRRFFQKLFSIEVGRVNIVNIILYTICILAASYAIYKLIQMRSQKAFVTDKEKGLDYSVHEENIHILDFESLISEAASQGQYRRGIRLIYLHALKKLSDAQKIDWQPGKTNHDYLAELSDEKLQPGFGDLSYFFDYAWYGEFDVEEKHLIRVRETFDNWAKFIRT